MSSAYSRRGSVSPMPLIHTLVSTLFWARRFGVVNAKRFNPVAPAISFCAAIMFCSPSRWRDGQDAERLKAPALSVAMFLPRLEVAQELAAKVRSAQKCAALDVHRAAVELERERVRAHSRAQNACGLLLQRFDLALKLPDLRFGDSLGVII